MSRQTIRHTIRLAPGQSRQLSEFARTKRISQSDAVARALASYFSPDGSDRIEAAISRRLDRLTRQYDRAAWRSDVVAETLALFIRTWLTHSAPLPDEASAAARATGKARWDSFVEALTRRLELGSRLSDEIARDIVPENDDVPDG